jgi:hypothetical protein
MGIERHLIMDSADAKPIISRVVVQDDRVYAYRIIGDPVGDATARTRQALSRIDHLTQAGTDNPAWNEWADPEHEIMVTAAR